MNLQVKLETPGHFINGVPVADDARTQPVFNPTTGPCQADSVNA